MSIDCQGVSDVELLHTYSCQELLIYRKQVKQYRQAVFNREHYKHNALTPHPQEPFINQTVTLAIDELLRGERASLSKLMF